LVISFSGFDESKPYLWALGCGHIDFRKVIETLKKINYQGYISAEILPLPDPDSCARLTAETLNKIGY
jgi:sugar phosphate isomerase/epimerase